MTIVQAIQRNQTMASRVIIGIFIVISTIVSYFAFDHVVIISSCTIGSYILLRVSQHFFLKILGDQYVLWWFQR